MTDSSSPVCRTQRREEMLPGYGSELAMFLLGRTIIVRDKFEKK